MSTGYPVADGILAVVLFLVALVGLVEAIRFERERYRKQQADQRRRERMRIKAAEAVVFDDDELRWL